MSNAEIVCREFAAQYPTANVQKAIAYAEAGALPWTDLARLFEDSLRKGLAEVR